MKVPFSKMRERLVSVYQPQLGNTPRAVLAYGLDYGVQERTVRFIRRALCVHAKELPHEYQKEADMRPLLG